MLNIVSRISYCSCRYVTKINRNNAILPRFFMSKSFYLQEEWDKRKKSPILSKIDVDDLFCELDNQFNTNTVASALDIDLFANAISDENHIDEVEDLVHKLRFSTEAVNILDSTQHAFIRLFLSFGSSKELMRILHDRLNYGIFPDDYCLILLMDKFIKEKNYSDAAKVAVLPMLQEDFQNPIVKNMALYSCLKYIENPSPWYPQTEETKQIDEDEEEIKVRVRYLRNPYCDDHFDLVDPYHLIGKTFYMIGKKLSNNVGMMYQILGSGFFNKYSILKSLLESSLDSNKKPLLFKDGITLLSNYLNNLPGKDGDDNKPLEEIKGLLKKLETSGSFHEKSLLQLTEENLQNVIKERENVEIENQLKKYQEWELLRADLLEKQIQNLNREKQLLEIKDELKKIKEKEEELFFFENENKIDLINEQKYKSSGTKPVKTEKGGKNKKNSTTLDEDYIPPEITRNVA
uniref:28S ribosomal protein S27, mitochondrial n=1 Tax=Clastoptera arizonana TaxID=38151 RepID=A0A1B6EEN2_9HEMI